MSVREVLIADALPRGTEESTSDPGAGGAARARS